MVTDGLILFMGREPINAGDCISKLKDKFYRWMNFTIPERKLLIEGSSFYGGITKIESVWGDNCRILNYAIADKQRNQVMKYIVAAPTGSAKTEGLISYCSMLPENITVLISTNLTREADKIAELINKEAIADYNELYKMAFINGKAYIPENPNLPRAYAYHSNVPKEDALNLRDVAKFQILVTTHAFYKNNYSGGTRWDLLAKNRDLHVIDEALETLNEFSVKDSSIKRAIMIFESIQKSNKFKENSIFEKELQLLVDELQVLKDYKGGTNLISSDKSSRIKFKWSTNKINFTLKNFQYQHQLNYNDIYKEPFNKYQLFSEILAQSISSGKSMKHFISTVNFNYIISGKKDESDDARLKTEVIEVINNLNLMNRMGQVYITANQGENSFHRVTDIEPTKSIVCFDATADINEIYKIRRTYLDDIYLSRKVDDLRDYSNVTLYTTTGQTGKQTIDNDLAINILNSVQLGKKTLIVTNLKNEHFFMQRVNSTYSDKIIEVAHWGAITGLNKWNDFDTCIVAGLNHKPKSYAQNRLIISTGDEEIAFGEKQDMLNANIEYSVILAEIIQAINRIRIRQIIDIEGNCDSANIYMILPEQMNAVYKKQIAKHMPNIKILDWILKESNGKKPVSANFDILVKYLETNINQGERKLKKEIIDESNINTNFFRTMMGKSSIQKQAFRDKLLKCGFEIDEVKPRGRKTSLQYFRKI